MRRIAIWKLRFPNIVGESASMFVDKALKQDRIGQVIGQSSFAGICE